VTGFTGRITDHPIPASIPRFKEVFGRLAKRAEDKGVKLAFENCDMGGNWNTGDWNIAHNPSAWELMFDAVPMKNLGLEWEPCHQMVNLIDPIPQLRKWAGKMFHSWQRRNGCLGHRKGIWDWRSKTICMAPHTWLRGYGLGKCDIHPSHGRIYRKY
jgi:hypothetical protein